MKWSQRESLLYSLLELLPNPFIIQSMNYSRSSWIISIKTNLFINSLHFNFYHQIFTSANSRSRLEGLALIEHTENESEYCLCLLSCEGSIISLLIALIIVNNNSLGNQLICGKLICWDRDIFTFSSYSIKIIKY